MPLCLAVLAGGGCGNDDELGPGVAARVGDVTITQAAVNHYVATQLEYQGRKLAGWMPPRFSDCVATTRTSEDGSAPLSERDARAECANALMDLRAHAIDRLIQAQWLAREVDRAGLPYTPHRDPQVNKDENMRLNIEQRTNALLERVRVTPNDIARYYRAHRRDYPPSRKRDAWFLRVPTLAQARAAKSGLAQGMSWGHTMERAKQTPATRGDAYHLTEHRFKDPKFDAALFSAPVEKVRGPIRTPLGWYVFEVFRAYSGPTQPPADAKEAIVSGVRIEKLDAQLRAHNRGATVCAAEWTAHPTDIVPQCE